MNYERLLEQGGPSAQPTILPQVGGRRAGPRNEHGKARLTGPHPLRGYPTYVSATSSRSGSPSRDLGQEVPWGPATPLVPFQLVAVNRRQVSCEEPAPFFASPFFA